MKKPDPSRFTGKKEHKADELEMRGFSTPPLVDKPMEQTGQERPPRDRNENDPETKQPSSEDTVVPRHHDTTIEEIRKAVKVFGKEAATHRFTQEEKQRIAELIFIYSNEGIRTSENEISRIAVNFLVQDFKLSKKHSILERVLKLLNS